MLGVSAMFVAACMILISVSFGAVLHLTLGLPPTGAVLCAVAALTGLVLCTIVAGFRRERTSADQVADLSRGIADLARQVTELGRRLAGMEGRVADALSRAEAATAPLSAEIGEIGEIVKELAQAVSTHEIALQEAAALPPYPAEPPSRAQDEARTSMPVLLSPAGNAKMQKWIDAGAEPGGTAMAAVVTADAPARSGFKSLAPAAATAVIRDAVEGNRVEFHLQPIVPCRNAKCAITRRWRGCAPQTANWCRPAISSTSPKPPG